MVKSNFTFFPFLLDILSRYSCFTEKQLDTINAITHWLGYSWLARHLQTVVEKTPRYIYTLIHKYDHMPCVTSSTINFFLLPLPSRTETYSASSHYVSNNVLKEEEERKCFDLFNSLSFSSLMWNEQMYPLRNSLFFLSLSFLLFLPSALHCRCNCPWMQSFVHESFFYTFYIFMHISRGLNVSWKRTPRRWNKREERTFLHSMTSTLTHSIMSIDSTIVWWTF